MASRSQGLAAPAFPALAGRNGLIDKYFYFAMSLVIAAIVVAGFSRTVDQHLFHASPPRPFLLWIHGAAFSGWVLFYIFQSALVRTHNVKVHRTLGWFGVALGACMVPLGFTVAVVMGRFDTHVLHYPGMDAFLIVPFYDMAAFGTLVTLAILWRSKPELHRRLLFIATCCLLDAAFARFDYIFNHGYFFQCLDAVILLGVVRDLLVNRRIHKVYLVTMPILAVAQTIVTQTWLRASPWWTHIAHRILG
ncbi:MAG TPA: hypothetical protein VND90_09325 [Terracidiphilus sp.]|nr:hypothetical protein [Terracidiphilus sp.]